jgi:hypothetical protein
VCVRACACACVCYYVAQVSLHSLKHAQLPGGIFFTNLLCSNFCLSCVCYSSSGGGVPERSRQEGGREAAPAAGPHPFMAGG